MNQMELVDLLEWHDGILHEVKISHENGLSVKIAAEIYKDQVSDRERVSIIIEFIEVDLINCCIDGDEMKDNLDFGNINDGYIKKFRDLKGVNFFYIFSIGSLILHFWM